MFTRTIPSLYDGQAVHLAFALLLVLCLLVVKHLGGGMVTNSFNSILSKILNVSHGGITPEHAGLTDIEVPSTI
jgi:hypothetical protein